MRFLFLVLFFSFVAHTVFAQADFRTLHSDAHVVDGHNDVLYRVMSDGEMETYGKRGHSDIPRFARGGLDVQVFSIWVPSKVTGAKAWKFALDEIDSLKAIANRNEKSVRLVLNHRDMDAALASGKLAAVIGLEGGRCIDGKRDRIITLYQRGLRSCGLTWNFSSDWASCSKDESAGTVKGGLSAKGKSFVHLLDSLGVLIDVSHLGEKSFWDVLAETQHPIIASHSACKELRNHHRNLSDTQLRAITKNGGVAMINFYPGFLASNLDNARIKRMRAFTDRHAALKNKYPDRGKSYLAAVDRLVAEAATKELVTLHTLIDHIDHAVRVAGIDHVGLGSDFDGIGLTPIGLHDVTDLPLLTRELLHRGYDELSIRKILGANFLRAFRTVCTR
jgi:membrane dipeptidase